MNNLLNLLLLSTASSLHRSNRSHKNIPSTPYRNDQGAFSNTPNNTNNNANTTPNATSNNTNTTNNPNNNTTSGTDMTTNSTNNTATNTSNNINLPFISAQSNLTTPGAPTFSPEVDALLPNGLKGRYVLPPLPFAYDALEPYIGADTMRIHHGGHHQNYVNELNNAISRYPELYAYTLAQLLTFATDLPSDIQSAVINNGGGHYNHTFLWNTLSPDGGGEPTGAIGDAINQSFGSFSNFRRAFSAAALSVFGSGYAWLVLTPGGRLEIITTRNQDTPLSLGFIPLLAIDVWEHAYYLNYQNNRNRYIENWFNVINWPYVNSIYEAAMATMPNMSNNNNSTNNNNNNNMSTMPNMNNTNTTV